MTWALVLKYWRELGLVAFAILLAIVWHAHDNALLAKGRAEEASRHADSVLAAIKPQQARVDTVYKRDTVRLARLRTTYDTVRDTVLKHLTDTAYVDRFVTVADSTIHACSVVISDCQKKGELAAIQIAALQAKLAAQPAVSKKSCLGWSAASAGAGLIAGVFIRR